MTCSALTGIGVESAWPVTDIRVVLRDRPVVIRDPFKEKTPVIGLPTIGRAVNGKGYW